MVLSRSYQDFFNDPNRFSFIILRRVAAVLGTHPCFMQNLSILTTKVLLMI